VKIDVGIYNEYVAREQNGTVKLDKIYDGYMSKNAK